MGSLHDWSVTAAPNATADATINWAEGQDPGTVNDSARAMMASLKKAEQDISAFNATTGSANAYVLVTSQIVTVLANGLILVARANFTNTGGATLKVDSTTATDIENLDGTPLVAGQIVSGGICIFCYSGTTSSWQLLNSFTSAPSAANIWSAVQTIDMQTPIFRVTNSASGANSIGYIEQLNANPGSNVTFEGRFGASFRRSDATAIASGQGVGGVMFGGQWGTDITYQAAKVLYPASIVGMAEGNFSAAGAMPTGIAFRTGVVGDALVTPNLTYGTERMRLANDGGFYSFGVTGGSKGNLTLNWGTIYEGGTSLASKYSQGSLLASFSANKGSSTQAVAAANTLTQVTFGTEVYDVGAKFASSTWTPPAGTVAMTTTVGFTGLNLATYAVVVIKKNGTGQWASALPVVTSSLSIPLGNGELSTPGVSVTLTVQDQANGTDTYTVFCMSDDASFTVLGDTGNTFFMGTMT